jgi:ABC-type branched-subunit amino acid transport system substrate-binding protein
MPETPSPRRRRTRLRVALALLGAAGALSACNSSANDAPTQVATASGGCQGGRIVGVGASLDLSGPAGAVGRAYLTGLRLGIAKVNSAGGVPGHNSCLELLYKNNRGSAAVDTQSMLNLVYAEGALVVVGSYLQTSATGGAQYLHALAVPVSSFSSAPETFDPKTFPNTFPLATSITVQSQVMANFAEKQDLTKVAVVVTRDATSRQGAAAFSSSVSSDGLDVVGHASVSPSGAGAVGALSSLESDHPKAVVVIDDGGAIGAVLSARRQLGWTVPFIVGPAASTTPALAAAGSGGRSTVWTVVPSATVTSSGAAAATAIAFRNQLLGALHESHLAGSIIPYAQGFDAATMFGSAAAGTMDTLVSDLTTYLENANYQGVLASYSYTSAQHNGILENELSVVPLSTLSNGVFHYAPPKAKKKPV